MVNLQVFSKGSPGNWESQRSVIEKLNSLLLSVLPAFFGFCGSEVRKIANIAYSILNICHHASGVLHAVSPAPASVIF
jgi:hypothetical protein